MGDGTTVAPKDPTKLPHVRPQAQPERSAAGQQERYAQRHCVWRRVIQDGRVLARIGPLMEGGGGWWAV